MEGHVVQKRAELQTLAALRVLVEGYTLPQVSASLPSAPRTADQLITICSERFVYNPSLLLQR
jgi:hypothetical protein